MTDLSSKMKILGKPAFVMQSNILHNQRIGRVQVKHKAVSLQYIYYFLRTRKVIRKIKETSTGTMVRHTAPKRILAIEMAYPKEDAEQKRIVEKLTLLSAETQRLEAVYRQKLENLAALEQAILQKAFAGELTARSVKAVQEAAE